MNNHDYQFPAEQSTAAKVTEPNPKFERWLFRTSLVIFPLYVVWPASIEFLATLFLMASPFLLGWAIRDNREFYRSASQRDKKKG